MWRDRIEVEDLKGKVITAIDRKDDEAIFFYTQEGTVYKMYHDQDCCESVYIEDIIGDLNDLVGTPLTMAEEESNSGEEGKWGGTYTWTFYKFATLKGYVTIRWYGSSNGYYSESVVVERV